MGWWRGRGARRGLLALWAIAVVRLTLWPAPAPDDTFDVVRAVIGWFVDHGIPVTYAGVEAVANVLMFVPFGVLTGLLLVRRWPIVPMAAALSGAIELSQLLFLPTRVPTVQDVVLNTLGAGLGLLALTWWSSRDHDHASGTPGRPRTAVAGSRDD
ncbi:VanZ family protein [Cellulomonas soli]